MENKLTSKSNEDMTVFFNEGKLVTTSRKVAMDFGKEHKNVLAKIDKTIENWSLDNELKNKLVKYFIESDYKDAKGEIRKEYLLTRDGFSYITMGFTGIKADKWKVKYIDKFNMMEKTLIDKSNQLTGLEPQILQLAQAQQIVGSVVQGMQVAINNVQTFVKEYVKDSIDSKDLQIDKTAEMIGIRAKNTMTLAKELKEKLSKIYGQKIYASNPIYIKVKEKIFREFKVCTWEQIPIGKFNEVFAYIDSLEDMM